MTQPSTFDAHALNQRLGVNAPQASPVDPTVSARLTGDVSELLPPLIGCRAATQGFRFANASFRFVFQMECVRPTLVTHVESNVQQMFCTSQGAAVAYTGGNATWTAGPRSEVEPLNYGREGLTVNVPSGPAYYSSGDASTWSTRHIAHFIPRGGVFQIYTGLNVGVQISVFWIEFLADPGVD